MPNITPGGVEVQAYINPPELGAGSVALAIVALPTIELKSAFLISSDPASTFGSTVS